MLFRSYNVGKHKIKQYNPAQKKFLVSEDPIKELKMKIINGDSGDGIPNILSASDTFVTGQRQKRMTEQRMEKYLNENFTNYDTVANTGFARNQVLIDLTHIPDDIKTKIINTYEETKPAPKGKLLNYFITYKLKNLMDVIGEF